MGTAASIEAASTLPSAADVQAGMLNDHFRKAMTRNQEFLHRERKLCQVSGFEASAHFAQPLMKAKMQSTLQSLDDISSAYCEDQKHRIGHAEVAIPELSNCGSVQSMLVLKDKATLACFTENGPIWIYNWREGRVVSKLRDKDPEGPMWGGGTREGNVTRLCVCSDDSRLLASGDERGFVAIWDLAGPTLYVEARLHEKAVSAFAYDSHRHHLYTTSEDCYIIQYDIEGQQVLDRAVPASLTCGSGVPNACMCLGGDSQPNLVYVCGLDGKMRIWCSDSGKLQHIDTVKIGSVTPTQCFMSPNGQHILVAASLGDSSFTGARPERGGLYVFDAQLCGRGKDPNKSPLVAKYLSRTESSAQHSREGSRATSLRSGTRGSMGSAISGVMSKLIQGTGIGCADVALCEEDGHTLAVCVMDNVIRCFDLDLPVQNPNRPPSARWEFDVVQGYEPEWAHPCAISACDRYVFCSTSAPSVAVWRRPLPGAKWGHKAYDNCRPPNEKLELRARVGPLDEDHRDFQEDVLVADPTLRPGEVLSSVQRSLERDRQRSSIPLNDRMITGALKTLKTEECLLPLPEDPPKPSISATFGNSS